MSTTPLFSVLIANYNNGQYIKEAIESVKAQDYNNWEIIIVDDASIDNSKDIYNEYSNDNRIKIYYNSENKGVTYSKWKCLEYAKGDICGFLDADDTILPHALSLMISEHSKDEDISIISSRYYICDEHLNIQKESGYLRIPEGESYLTYMQYAPWPFISFKMLKYRQTKGLNPLNKIGDDQELCLLLEEVGKWRVIDEITYKYRQNNNSISKEKESECWYWNIIVYHEACMRRGIDPKLCSYQIYLDRINCFTNKKFQEYIRINKAYKIGMIILKPLYFIKRMVIKLLHT